MLHIRISRRGKHSHPVGRDAVRIAAGGIGDATEAIDGLEDILTVRLRVEVNQDSIAIENGNVINAVFRSGDGKSGAQSVEA